MPSCVSCGSEIPADQGSRTCSLCYGDPGHGKDGYYQNYLDEWERQARSEQDAREAQREEKEPTT